MDSGIEWGSSMAAAWGISRKGVIEGAKEELEILEMQHPNNFHTLKLELRAFISDLHHHSHNNAAISTATQESSSSRKLKRNSDGSGGGMMKRRRRRTDAVLERAQQCLHKIQHLKTSLC
ncbi:uncharacterized protein LOC105179802 [Sesamum indicum]|uniref:Uncharacterized protein LOC105179802 n=1 Tax=Sesamum indicum TaxID=4182 RepID=A0A6I9UQ16_SESIN|nr:uncharacterized protein LOC105179802 [Sesamum indicum]